MTMIARVARAIDPEAHERGCGRDHWSYKRAEAAIMEMREPISDKMIAAFEKGRFSSSAYAADDTFADMIDAALSDPVDNPST